MSTRRKSLRRVKVTITLPKYLLDAIDGLAEIVETSRSTVIELLTDYDLNHEDIIDEVFPIEEQEETERE